MDLFTGIAGISLALSEWVRPIAYCENDTYAQGVLLARMADRHLPIAPIWDDVRTLKGSDLPIRPDIIYGGFPCQDLSCAGRGKGLEGDRSRLVFEVLRLAEETRVPFLFLENVPAIRTRGLRELLRALTDLRYDCRWTVVSAAEVGAPHIRRRWFLLGYSKHNGYNGTQNTRSDAETFDRRSQGRKNEIGESQGTSGLSSNVSHSNSECSRNEWESQSGGEVGAGGSFVRYNGEKEFMADSNSIGLQSRLGIRRYATSHPKVTDSGQWEAQSQFCRISHGVSEGLDRSQTVGDVWDQSDGWEKEWEGVPRVIQDLPYRADRLHCLGNSVVPAQVRTAFRRLMCLDE